MSENFDLQFYFWEMTKSIGNIIDELRLIGVPECPSPNFLRFVKKGMLTKISKFTFYL